MKVIIFHFSNAGIMKRIMDQSRFDDFMVTLERGFKSRKLKNVIVGEDINGNHFYVRLEEVMAVETNDFDIHDL